MKIWQVFTCRFMVCPHCNASFGPEDVKIDTLKEYDESEVEATQAKAAAPRGFRNYKAGVMKMRPVSEWFNFGFKLGNLSKKEKPTKKGRTKKEE